MVEMGIPVFLIRREIAKVWLQVAGQDLNRLQEELDGSLRPREFLASSSILLSLLLLLLCYFQKV